MSKFSGSVQVTDGTPYDTGSTAKVAVGTRMETNDGKVYRYALNGGTALAPGKLVVTATQVANHENIAVAAAAAVGETEITVTLGATAATANQYAGGSLVVNDADGEGIAYEILGHPAADASASLVVTIDTPGVQVALTTSSEVSLIANSFSGVVISVADQADTPVGVPNVAIAANEYGWIQTKGDCSVLADETLTVGHAVTTGSSTVGSVELLDAAGEVQVGIAKQAGVDTEYRLVDLTLD